MYFVRLTLLVITTFSVADCTNVRKDVFFLRKVLIFRCHISFCNLWYGKIFWGAEHIWVQTSSIELKHKVDISFLACSHESFHYFCKIASQKSFLLAFQLILFKKFFHRLTCDLSIFRGFFFLVVNKNSSLYDC